MQRRSVRMAFREFQKTLSAGLSASMHNRSIQQPRTPAAKAGALTSRLGRHGLLSKHFRELRTSSRMKCSRSCVFSTNWLALANRIRV